MTGVKFDYCGGCGLQRSLVLRDTGYRCMGCLRKDDEDNGDFRAQEEMEMEIANSV